MHPITSGGNQPQPSDELAYDTEAASVVTFYGVRRADGGVITTRHSLAHAEAIAHRHLGSEIVSRTVTFGPWQPLGSET